MNKTTLSVTSPADVLAYVPHVLGFTPEESFVFMTLHGSMLGATLRLDAPAAAAPADYAGTVISFLLKDADATGVLFAAYTNEPGTGGVRPYTVHVETLEAELARVGLDMKAAWLVTDQGWKDYHCEQAPAPYEQIQDSILNATLIHAGSNAQRLAGIAVPAFTGTTDDLDLIASQIARWQDSTDSDEGMSEALRAWHESLDTTPERENTLELIGMLHVPEIRDRVMVATITTTDDPDTIATVVIGQYAEQVDWDRVDAIERLITVLFTHCPSEARPPLLTILGWISWYKGRSSTAGAYFTKATDAIPGYRLATLLQEIVNRGILPVVATTKTTAYRDIS